MSKNTREDKRRYKSNLAKKSIFSQKSSVSRRLRAKRSCLKLTKKCSPEEDKILSKCINSKNIKNFSEISIKLSGRTINQCRMRWKKSKRVLKKGQWSLHEDKLLKEWIEKNGPKYWEQCGQFIHGRSGKQCREHWINCLNPELIKGDWTTEEDFLIMHFYEKYNGSWKKIIYLFNGRSENSIKNRFFSQLRKLATNGMNIEERKKCSKIKLEELKNFLEEGLRISKKEFLKENPMNEEELNNYLNKMELKIKKKQKEENENESSFSTNLGEFENSLTLNSKNENEEKSFLRKRKREEESLDNTTEKEKSIFIHEEIENNTYNDLNDNKLNLLNENLNQNVTFENKEKKATSNNNIKIANNNDISFKIEEKENYNQENNECETININPFDIQFDNLFPASTQFLEKGYGFRTNSLGDIFVDDNDYINKEINNEENKTLFEE